MAGKRRGRGEGGVEELPSGKWRVVLSRTVAGRRHRESKAFPTKKEALAWRDARRGAGPSPAGTFGSWLDAWLPLHKAAVAPVNYQSVARCAVRFLRPDLGATPLRDLSPLVCRRYLAGLTGRATPWTAHHVGGCLRKCLNDAVAAGLLPASPMARVKVPRQPDPDTHALTPAELAAVLAAADRLGAGVIVRVLADAGLRPAELCGLRRGDWDGREL